MVDKQIIINNIDVSECEYYDENKPLLTCVCEEYPCSECPNCNYKKWKRKEQECEKLKDIANRALDKLNKYLDKQVQLDQLKAEKEKIEQCLIEQNRLVVGMTKEIDTLTYKKYELLQTLIEIKNIVEKAQWDYRMPKEVWDLILQKISESGVGNE